MTAPEQAPATVPREFWDLLHEWAESPSEERRDAIEHRFGELFALASRLSAPPAPQGEPVAEWEYRLQDRRGNWLPWALCTEAYAVEKSKEADCEVRALYTSPPPPPEPQEVEILTDEACDLLRRRWAIPRDAIEAVIEAFCETNELTLKENTRG